MADRPFASVGGQTYLADRPDIWRKMFPLDRRRVRFAAGAFGGPGRRVLDVGCATGELCGALARAGLRPTGVDVNPWFVRAASARFPDIPFRVADMRRLPFRRQFD